MASVFVTRTLPSSALSRLEPFDADVFGGDGVIPADELRRRVAGRDALVCMITDRIDSEVFHAGSSLKVIANVGVGYNNIDVGAARSRGVTVTNTPDVLTD